MRIIIALAAIVVVMTTAASSSAQDYPTRQVRVVIPFAAGAGTSVVGRLLSDELTKRLGHSFYIENKPGAGAQLGTDLVAKSPPDGYTLLWSVNDSLSILPAIKAQMPYNVPEDFEFIASTAQQPFALTVPAKLPFNTVADLVAYAKANPNKLNYGSAGVGSTPHMGLALMNAAAGIEMVHVPFAGLAPATNALIAATVDVGFTTPALAKPHVDAGTLRVLAVTSKKRYFLMPDVPTLNESGLNVSTTVAYGLSAPARTPQPILARLRQAITEIMKEGAVPENLRRQGFETDHLDGQAYKDFIVNDLAQWKSLAQKAKIAIEN